MPESPDGGPLVVGFAGARLLFDPAGHPDLDAEAFAAAAQLPFERLLDDGLTKFGRPWHGISSLAVGGDFLFARACRNLGRPHSILLPQPVEEFLAANGSSGPDFTPDQQRQARELLAGSNIASVRVAGSSSDRRRRFQEVNEAIAAASDALVCLLRADQQAKPGGTQELLELAKTRRVPALAIAIGVGAETPLLSTTWHKP